MLKAGKGSENGNFTEKNGIRDKNQ